MLHRRAALISALPSGLILLPGNAEAPMNYADNTYPFRQDSSFRYYGGPNRPDFHLLIDCEAGTTTLYGTDLSLDYVVWMGAQPSVRELADRTGIEHTGSPAELGAALAKAKAAGRAIHYLPPYRAERTLLLAGWLGVDPAAVGAGVSETLIRAVIAQRSVKSADEVREMERAVIVSGVMHRAAMRAAKPGELEAATAGLVEGIAIGAGGRLAYPAIVTVNGQILHNHYHGNKLKRGDLMLIDAGAQTDSGYAGDITRTFPVAAKFTSRQRDIYELVLRAENDCIGILQPKIAYRAVHLRAAHLMAESLRDLGLMRGSTEDAVAAGAHALFFPHGLGHHIGMDVHDMEDLGEDRVGYDEEISRSDQFGTKSLRLGRRLAAGNVITVEPGCYFIPALMDQWQA
ncbi:MAG: aminopeptidase P family protein, partial [Saprospiraceae bacterium]